MNDTDISFVNQFQQVSQWMLEHGSPTGIVCFGSALSELAGQLLIEQTNVWICVSCDQSMQFVEMRTGKTSVGPEAGTVDLIICSGNEQQSVDAALAYCNQNPPASLQIFVITVMTAALNDPERVAQTLFAGGYAHDLNFEFWADTDILVNRYCKKQPTENDRVPYEAELWRLQQLSQKRRSLLQEYRAENVFETIRMQGEYQIAQNEIQIAQNEIQKLRLEIDRLTKYIQEKEPLANRWLHFSGTAAGKIYLWLSGIKTRLRK